MRLIPISRMSEFIFLGHILIKEAIEYLVHTGESKGKRDRGKQSVAYLCHDRQRLKGNRHTE